ncbi:MAG TPA: FKBP-type peptidyl-prolyl cis-trans isomerase [Thermoanaerobaculia bacterium]|nr:FKBP-type peptidyl-prolyl cis-trans isomerase [Thermoanaerobaculia bacterium]
METKTFSRALFAAALMAVVGSFAVPVFAGQDPGAENGREVVTPSGLKYVDLRLGQGDEAAQGKIVEVHYVGSLEDGTKFDSSKDRDRPFTFRLGAGDALKGWDEGLVGMKVGGRRRLVIPPGLGFGKQGVGSVVPPNAILVYEFDLLGVR